MTYEEKRAQYGTDEAMARAMFNTAVSLQLDVERMQRLLDLSQARCHKAEMRLYNLQNPIKKTNYILEPQ